MRAINKFMVASKCSNPATASNPHTASNPATVKCKSTTMDMAVARQALVLQCMPQDPHHRTTAADIRAIKVSGVGESAMVTMSPF